MKEQSRNYGYRSRSGNDSSQEGRTQIKFVECETRLYYYNGKTTNTSGSNNKNKASVTPYVFVQTVANKKKLYHKQEINRANEARDLYIKLGRQSQQKFQKMLAKT